MLRCRSPRSRAALWAGLYWLDRRASATPRGQPISHVLAVASPRTITTGLLLLTGALLVAGVYVGAANEVNERRHQAKINAT